MSESNASWDFLQPKHWFVLRKGQLSGPLSEAEVRRLVMEPAIEEDMMVRQGDSPFFPAAKVRQLFVTLETQGYFVRDGDIIYGPYVGNKLLALVHSGFFSAEKILVRLGTSGSWTTFKELKRSYRRQYRKAQKALQASNPLADASEKAVGASGTRESSQILGALPAGNQPLDSDAKIVGSELDRLITDLSKLASEDRASEIPQLDAVLEVTNDELDEILHDRFETKPGDAGRSELKPIASAPLNAPTHRSTQAESIPPNKLVIETERDSSIKKEPAEKSTRPDGPPPLPKTTSRTCPDCGRKLVGKAGLCKHCRTKNRKDAAKKAKQKERLRISTEDTVENYAGKLMMLAIAFGTSGFFLCKWLVSVGLWRDFHTRDQQMLGWACLAVGLILAMIGSLVIHSDPYRKNDRKMIATGTLSLFLVGLVYYVGKTSQLRSHDEDMQKQNMAWTEIMEQGGYLDPEE